MCSKFTWDTKNIKTNYIKTKRYPDIFGELPLTGVIPSRDSERRWTIARIAKTNAIFTRPVNKLFPTENTYQDSKQTGMARQQKLRRQAAVIGELKRNMNVYCANTWGRSFNITNMNLLIRFNKTREIFPSVTRVLSILITTSAISASVEKANFKGRVA